MTGLSADTQAEAQLADIATCDDVITPAQYVLDHPDDYDVELRIQADKDIRRWQTFKRYAVAIAGRDAEIAALVDECAALAAHLEAAERAEEFDGSYTRECRKAHNVECWGYETARASVRRAVAAEGERDEARANETAWAKTSATGQAALKRTRLRAEAAEGRLEAAQEALEQLVDAVDTYFAIDADDESGQGAIAMADRDLGEAIHTARAVLAGGDDNDS